MHHFQVNVLKYQHLSLLSDDSCSLHCDVSSGSDDSGGKCAHFGGNLYGNPSLRTPSYVLLAGLAFTDVCTGLLSLPSYVANKITELTGNRKIICTTALINISVTLFFSNLTVVVIVMSAVERWLYMSRRSLLTVRRVVILYITFLLMIIPFVAVAISIVC